MCSHLMRYLLLHDIAMRSVVHSYISNNQTNWKWEESKFQNQIMVKKKCCWLFRDKLPTTFNNSNNSTSWFHSTFIYSNFGDLQMFLLFMLCLMLIKWSCITIIYECVCVWHKQLAFCNNVIMGVVITSKSE